MTVAAAHAIAGGIAIALFIVTALAALGAWLCVERKGNVVIFFICAGGAITSGIPFLIALCIWLTTFGG